MTMNLSYVSAFGMLFLFIYRISVTITAWMIRYQYNNPAITFHEELHVGGGCYY